MNTIFDLRTPDAFLRGSVPGAKNVPLRHLQKELMPRNRRDPIILIDDDFSIASLGRTYAMGMGFTNITISTVAKMRAK